MPACEEINQGQEKQNNTKDLKELEELYLEITHILFLKARLDNFLNHGDWIYCSERPFFSRGEKLALN